VEATAAAVIRALRAESTAAELAKVRGRLAPGEPAIGVRMGTLFDIAKQASAMPMSEVEALMAEPEYEPRLAAFCVLDFQARRRLGDAALFDCYLRHHDRITSWDMVDRAAPRVVGAHVAGTDLEALHRLASSPEPLRRRTAMTAPLWFVRKGSDADLAGGFALASALHADPDPLVTNAVGIFLAHAGTRDPDALIAVLEAHAGTMPRPAVRLAIRKLGPERSRFLGRGSTPAAGV
jgi:3-methyladenine DNA glycosylase AlkD